MEGNNNKATIGIPNKEINSINHDNHPSLEMSNEHRVVDIGINLTHPQFKNNWREVVRRAVDAGVDRIMLTGLTMEESRQSLEMAQQWHEETGNPNLYVTIGVHPYYANTWVSAEEKEEGEYEGLLNNNKKGEEEKKENDETSPEKAGNEEVQKTKKASSLEQMKELLCRPLALAVGECGLDYHSMCATGKKEQIQAFREQLMLACELDMPVFLHEREAHEDFVSILDEMETRYYGHLPPVVVHCFTGTAEEAATYTKRGYFIGFAGTICQKSRGAHLREILPTIPTEKIMVETDAPFMRFKKGKQYSEPADCIDVALKVGDIVGLSFEEVCAVTTCNAMDFFRIPK